MLSLTLPIRLESVANLAESWHAKHKRNSKQRFSVELNLCSELNRKPCKLPVSILLTRIAPRQLDDHDNLKSAFKHVVDGVTRALGLKNDRDPQLQWEYAQKRGEPKQYAIRIDIIEIERE